MPLNSLSLSQRLAHSKIAGLCPADTPTLVNGSSVPSSPESAPARSPAGEDQVDDAVLELLRQVGGLAAELHARIDLDLQLAAGRPC